MMTYSFLLSQLLTTLPIAIVFIAGIVLSVMNWERHPKPASLALIASILGIVRTFASPVFTFWVTKLSGGPAGHQPIFTLWSIAMVILSVAIYALLLTAVFSGRHTGTTSSSTSV
jgi:hypothetical protein